jgi:hypothetical protein
MIAMIQGELNQMKWRDKAHDHCECTIERGSISDEEPKEAIHSDLIGRVEGERRARIKNINRPSKRKEKGI